MAVRYPGCAQGYIDWERFEANQRRLADNARAFGASGGRGRPAKVRRYFRAACCAACVASAWACATVRSTASTVPTYVCQETAVRRGGKLCQTVPGKVVDAAVAAC